MLTALIVVTALAAAPADVAIVVARKQGVSQGQADAILNMTAKAFDDANLRVQLPDVDVLKCGGKRSCLVGIGRTLKVPVLVTIEIGAVLDEVDVFIEALAIEQDGRKLGRAERHAGLDDLAPVSKNLTTLTEPVHKYVKPMDKFVSKNADVVDAGAPMVKAPEPIDAGVVVPVVVDAGIAAMTANVTIDAGSVSTTSAPAVTARNFVWAPSVLAGIGAVMTGVGFAVARSTETELRASGDLTQVRALASRGEAFQSVGVVGIGLAAAGVVTAVIMFIAGAPPSGASASLSSTQPGTFAWEFW